MSNLKFENVLKEVHETEQCAKWKRVMVVWESPITQELDHREFYFTSNIEAQLKLEEIEKKYSNLKVVYEVYLDNIDL